MPTGMMPPNSPKPLLDMYRVAYGKIAAGEFTVSTSGPCTSDITRLPYTKLRRPVYPLDRLEA